jgi:hypothetical protein
MKNVTFYAMPVLVLSLAGCGPAQQTGTQLANDFKDNMYKTSEKVKEWAMTPPPKPAPLPVPDSYCYHVLQDILCYRQPMPGWEHRLVGYQGTDAREPAFVMTEPLPVHTTETRLPPGTRESSVIPVFIAPPPEIKTVAKSGDDAAVASHEQLPDPALAPQL